MNEWKNWTLAQKVGQLFILAFPGKNPQTIVPLMHRYQIGGCYISQDNAETFDEAKVVTDTLQHSVSVPLFFGVDQEGAWGVLLPESTVGPGNLALGAGNDLNRTYQMYGIFAEEMGSVGYQVILAPCADVNLDPHNPIIDTRSFGDDPQLVARHVAQAVRGIQDHGGIATAKHFPGHGDTHTDTHRDIPVVDKPLEELMKYELLPFQSAIDAGVDMIMTSHILFPQVDPAAPATLSSLILSDLLRTKMGFSGLIITDSMNMGAIRKNYSLAESTLMSLKAGADLVMLSEEHYDHSEKYLEKQIASIESVIEAVQNGYISMELIDEKLARIIAFKKKRLRAPTTRFSTSQKREVMNAAAMAGVRVLRDELKLLPLHRDMRIALVNATPRSAYTNLINVRGIGPNQKEAAFDGFVQEFLRFHSSAQVYEHEDRPNFSSFDRILLVTENHPLPGEDFDTTAQHVLLRNLLQHVRDKLVVIGLRSPGELVHFPELPCYLSAHSGRTVSARMAARFLAGE